MERFAAVIARCRALSMRERISGSSAATAAVTLAMWPLVILVSLVSLPVSSQAF